MSAELSEPQKQLMKDIEAAFRLYKDQEPDGRINVLIDVERYDIYYELDCREIPKFVSTSGTIIFI